jgi:hypothetical protein
MSKLRRVVFTVTVLTASLLPATSAMAAINHCETLLVDQ